MDILLSPGQLALGLEPSPSGTTGLEPFTGTPIPRSAWVSTDALKPFVPRGKCQFSVPACTEYTNGKMYQTKLAHMTGRPGFVVPISYCANHQEITNGNMNRGSRAVDCIRQMVEKGLYPAGPNLPEWFDRPRQLPAVERTPFAGDEWEEIFDADEVVSSLLGLNPVNVGFDWCQRDVTPGPAGHLVMDAGRVLGGHSVLACGVVMGYTPSPSHVGILFSNHHGDSQTPNQRNEFGQDMGAGVWGADGFGVVPIERVAAGIPKYSCCTLRTVKVRNEDIP